MPQGGQTHADSRDHVEAEPHDRTEGRHEDGPPHRTPTFSVAPQSHGHDGVQDEHDDDEELIEVLHLLADGEPREYSHEPQHRYWVLNEHFLVSVPACQPRAVVVHVPGDVVARGVAEHLEHDESAEHPQEDDGHNGEQFPSVLGG